MTIIKNANNNKINYLVCVNNEKYSETALQFACNLAKTNNGLITILHVIEPSEYHSFGGIEKAMQTEQQNNAQELMDNLSQKASEWFGASTILQVKEGKIENEIIQVVENDKTIKMMIVGAAPDGASKSKILPPLVSSLGSKLSIPMLIIPGNLSDEQIEDLT